MNFLQSVDGEALRYGRLIGTGGIGTGMVFMLEGNHTLGRNESRLGALVPYRDYCKLHIIAHYIAVLLGAAACRFAVHAIGKIGHDDPGASLLDQMRGVGMDVRAVETAENAVTLFSACFQYPDSSGGNVTTSNSASALVSPEDAEAALAGIPRDACSEIVLAVPEVPVAARIALLCAGKRRGCLTVASLLSHEAAAFAAENAWETIDVLAVNIDEAAAIAGGDAHRHAARKTAEACAGVLFGRNAKMRVVVTDGKNGSYAFAGGSCAHMPALPVQAVSTGGAGDAFLAGMVAGLCCGLPFLPEAEGGSLSGAMGLGTLLAAFSVTSPHTIHPDACADALALWAWAQDVPIWGDLARLLPRRQ